MLQGESSGRSTPSSDSAPGKLFVGGLSWQTNQDRLREYFGQFGSVTDVLVMKDPITQVTDVTPVTGPEPCQWCKYSPGGEKGETFSHLSPWVMTRKSVWCHKMFGDALPIFLLSVPRVSFATLSLGLEILSPRMNDLSVWSAVKALNIFSQKLQIFSPELEASQSFIFLYQAGGCQLSGVKARCPGTRWSPHSLELRIHIIGITGARLLLLVALVTYITKL